MWNRATIVFKTTLVKCGRFSSTSSKFIANCPPPAYDTGCTYCQIPEFTEPIDFEKNLNNTKVLPWKHVLVLSHGYEDFETMPSKIDLVPGSVNSEIESLKRGLISSFHPIMVSNIILRNQKKLLNMFQINGPNDHLVYLFPDRKIVKFNLDHTEQFIRHYLVPKYDSSQPQQQVYNPFEKKSPREQKSLEPVDTSVFEEFPIENDLVLICGHVQRDSRCGKLAPLLQTEFEEVLSIENLDDSTQLGLVSHVGGHAYAGNVIYFPEEKDKEIIWYGRVFPENVQGIVRETMKKGNVIKDLFRGEV